MSNIEVLVVGCVFLNVFVLYILFKRLDCTERTADIALDIALLKIQDYELKHKYFKGK